MPPLQKPYIYNNVTCKIPRKVVKEGRLIFPQQMVERIDKEKYNKSADDDNTEYGWSSEYNLYWTKDTHRYGWEDTEHAHQYYAFNDTKKKKKKNNICCSSSGLPIEFGELMSVGYRYVAVGGDDLDDPPIEGVDRIHIESPINYEVEGSRHHRKKEYLNLKGVDITKLRGYDATNDEQKKKYLHMAGIDITAPLYGMVFLITGEVSFILKNNITKHGGQIRQDFFTPGSKDDDITHCIYGKTVIRHGTMGGKGSTQYKKCEKKNLPLLTPTQVEALWSTTVDQSTNEKRSGTGDGEDRKRPAAEEPVATSNKKPS